jgi:hypothetical protein
VVEISPSTVDAPVDGPRRLALVAGLLITLGLVVLHIEYYRHAGALWRDEVNSVNLAVMPSYAEVFANMHLDSFPAAWATVLHTWVALGLGDSDAGLRRLGLLIGLGTIAALWWTGWRLGVGPPLAALVLYGMSPTAIVYGDEVRGYGLAALALVWCTGALWGFVQRATTGRLVLALVATACAVQTHYANCILLPAVGAAAALVCVWRRNWRLLLAVAAIGAVAVALLLFVNVGTLAYMTQAGPIEQGDPKPFAWLLRVLGNSVAPGVPSLAVVWAAALPIAALGLALAWWSPQPAADAERALYAGVILVGAPALMILAYKWLRVPTQYWHYLSLIALVAVACDVGIALLARRVRRGEWVRAGALTAAALVAARGVAETVPLRMTNLDLVAQAIAEQGRAGDLAVVFPWYCGITFERYYRGPAGWITLPDFDEHKFHRHLLVAEKMKQGDAAVRPELDRVERTLRQGGRVWIVGVPVAPNADQPLAPLPLAPSGPLGWRAAPYLENWELQLGGLVETHAARGERVPIGAGERVNAWENLPVYRLEGWR